MLKKNPLLDKFCVGDALYHELSMITDGLHMTSTLSMVKSKSIYFITGCDMIDYNKRFFTCRIRVNKRPVLTINQTDLLDWQKLT